MEPTFCSHTYSRIGKTYICVSAPHPRRPDQHYFVQEDTNTPSARAAVAQHRATLSHRRGGLLAIPGDRLK